MAFRIARHLALTSRARRFSASNVSVESNYDSLPAARSSKYRTGSPPVVVNPRPARNQIVTVPGNISPAPEVDRSNSTERAKTDCLRKRECAIPRSSRKRCLPSARHQAVLSARKLNQRERASKLTPLR